MKAKVDMSEHAEDGREGVSDEEDSTAMEIEQVRKSEANYSLQTILTWL